LGPNKDIGINQAEKYWLQSLYAYAKELFQTSFLPSHDHTHHLRVWNIAKQILREMANTHSTLSPSLVEGVLISCFFHDLGMVQSTREDHGILGKDLCRLWFSENDRTPPPSFERILYAIEIHDRKEARYYSDPESAGSPGILGILAVADDLEAMGVIGIYRYAEIYLHRGISLEELGTRILANANQRFNNLLSSGMFPRTIQKYRVQFDELRNFFIQYNLQLKQVKNAEKIREGQLGVINYIRTRSMEGKVRPEDLSSLAEEEEKDSMLREYFSRLRKELLNARN
jgi:HD superfamily phosphodiesterase